MSSVFFTADSTAAVAAAPNTKAYNQPEAAIASLPKKSDDMFKYHPIHVRSGIRLLNLLPHLTGDRSTPLTGHFIHVDLNEPPPHTALSYCWRDDLIPDTYAGLHLSSTEHLEVTENLALALRQGAMAFRLATQLAVVVRDTVTEIGSPPMHLDKLDPQMCARYGIPTLREDRSAYLALSNLLNRPWFSRSWIVQEVSFQNADVYCGNSEIPFPDLVTALFCFQIPLADPFRATLQASLTFAGIRKAMDSLDSRILLQRPSRALLDVLSQHRCCQATNQKDKVFAFIGLANDAEDMGVRPDYSLSVEDVYRRTAMAMLKYYPHLDVLSAVKPVDSLDLQREPDQPGDSESATRNDAASPFTLPSWVPDWRNPCAGMSLRTRGYYGEFLGDYHASGISTPQVQFCNAETELGLPGLVLDRIVEVGEPYGLHYVGDHARTYDVLQQWERIPGARSGQAYLPVSGESALAAFATTLTCGDEKFISRQIKNVADSINPKALYRLSAQLWPEGDSFVKQYENHIRLLRIRAVYRVKGISATNNPMLYAVCVVVVVWFIIAKETFIAFRDWESNLDVCFAFKYRLDRCVLGRRFIRTKKGYFGLAAQAKPGDDIALVAGGTVPLVIRQATNSSNWELVGDGYVHGVMFGKAFHQDRCEDMWFV